jgi:hypothetical protein
MNPLIPFAAISFAVLALMAPVPAAIAQATDTSSNAKLLQQAKTHAAEANYDAALLDSYGRSDMDWRAHAQCLTNIKEHANDLFEDYYQLQRMRDKGTPQQREAIDRLEPLLRDMGTNLTDTIQNLNLHQGRVHMPSFRTRIHADYVAINKVYQLLCECTKSDEA